MDRNEILPSPFNREVSRRSLLRIAGGVTLAVGAGTVLAACSPGDTGSTAAPGPTGNPTRGGTLTVAITGGGAKETLDPHNQVSGIEFLRATNIYDRLTERLHDKINYRLATSMEPSPDALTWTIKLRPNVKWQDGKPFTGRDVVYSWRRMIRDNTAESLQLAPINVNAVEVIGDLELKVPMNYAFADLAPIFSTDQMQIIQDGFTDFAKPIGTGPFKLASFSPGREFVLERYDGYWESGLPYLDQVVVQALDDPTARLNALNAGQVDIASQVPQTQGRALVPNGTDLSKEAVIATPQGHQLVNSAATIVTAFVMDMTQTPYQDVNVRQAMKYAIDRDAVIKSAYAGFAVKGNDMFGLGFEGYPEIEQHEYDPEKARGLLKKAGHDGLSVTVVATSSEPGQVEVATVMQQTAKAAGIDLSIKKVPGSDFWSSYWMKAPFFPTWWTRKPFALQYGLSLASDAPNNESQQHDKALDARFRAAQGTLDEKKRNEMYGAINADIAANGGYIIPAWSNQLDLVSSKVGGVEAGGPNSLNDYRFRGLWKA